MTWKNLHFRPPVLTEQIVDGVSSRLLFIRNAGDYSSAFAGFILIRKSNPIIYKICGKGHPEHDVCPSQIEWMEVPE